MCFLNDYSEVKSFKIVDTVAQSAYNKTYKIC